MQDWVKFSIKEAYGKIYIFHVQVYFKYIVYIYKYLKDDTTDQFSGYINKMIYKQV